jgi:hypothetical protein
MNSISISSSSVPLRHKDTEKNFVIQSALNKSLKYGFQALPDFMFCGDNCIVFRYNGHSGLPAARPKPPLGPAHCGEGNLSHLTTQNVAFGNLRSE